MVCVQNPGETSVPPAGPGQVLICEATQEHIGLINGLNSGVEGGILNFDEPNLVFTRISPTGITPGNARHAEARYKNGRQRLEPILFFHVLIRRLKRNTSSEHRQLEVAIAFI